MRKGYFIILMLVFSGYLFAQPENFSTSLHKTRNGKLFWYGADTSLSHGLKPGFQTFTGIAIDTLGCIQCHGATDANGNAYPTDYSQGTCSDCHNGTPAVGTVVVDQCYTCHSRQGAEKSFYTDVHRDAGMACWDCHGTTDMHGDGTEYNSFLQAGAVSADCEDCHVEGNDAGAPVYDHVDVDPHEGELHCTACHTQSVITCYDCHFNSQVEAHLKRAYTKAKDFIILVNREKDGKVGTASFQSLTYVLPDGSDSTWVAFAPYTAHTTMATGRTCDDCHNNQNVQDYMTNGVIQFAKWNEADTTLTTLKGVVPFPYDYESSFKMDYITYTGDVHDPIAPSKKWKSVDKDTWDGHQLLFATPLDTDQMFFLSLDFGKVWANFDSSIHKSRYGKQFWYGKEYGGFETLTDVPIEGLGCRECHGATNADGEPYPDDYSRGECVDCHGTNTLDDDAALQTQCLSCHSRQLTEIGWINSGILENVHKDTLTCKDCHMPNEELNLAGTADFDDMHSMGADRMESYVSMLDPGVIGADCENCHDASTHSTSSDPHGGKISCEACHAATVITCYNCHFDSQEETHIKRAYTKVKNFVILANREKDGKVYPMTFQSLTYHDSLSWVAFGPFTPHSIMKNGRTCTDCHQNFGGSIPAITEYNTNHTMTFAKWNADDTTLTTLTGIIPMPVDYETQFKMDFLAYTGDVSDPAVPSKKWVANGKNTWDGHQMLYATPLTTSQMAKLGIDTSMVAITPEEKPQIVRNFELKQNYPNPFNPTTTIEFSLPHASQITLVVFDVLGKEITRIYDKEQVKSGTHKIEFDASKLASGIYFYQLRGDNFARTRKMFLLK